MYWGIIVTFIHYQYLLFSLVIIYEGTRIKNLSIVMNVYSGSFVESQRGNSVQWYNYHIVFILSVVLVVVIVSAAFFSLVIVTVLHIHSNSDMLVH